MVTCDLPRRGPSRERARHDEEHLISARTTARRALARVLGLLDRLVPRGDGVVAITFPDLDDNVVALLRDPVHPLLTVLAHDLAGARRRRDALRLTGVRLVRRHSLRGLWVYLRARVTLTSHGVLGSRRRPRSKQTIGLWHGEWGKLIGTFVGEPARHFDWVPVSSPLSRSHRAAEFALDPARIHVVGLPRQDLLRVPARSPDRDRRAVVWAPTYRTSVTGHLRTDGDPSVADRALRPDDPALRAVLEEHGAVLWYRPHPASEQTRLPADGPVRLASDQALEAHGLSFYELLSTTECLVTDYSSLWVDYLLRDRPMIAFCPDLDEYRANRGLALEPHEEWFPGPVVTRRTQLLSVLSDSLAGTDSHAAQRRRTARQLHTTAGGATPAVLDAVGGARGT